MSRRKHLKATTKPPGAAVKAVRKPRVSKVKHSLSILSVARNRSKLASHGVADHLSAQEVLALYRHVRTQHPIRLRKTDAYGINPGEDLLTRAIRH